MKKYTGILLAIGSLALASQVRANTTVFSDNFNTENGGVGALNYNGFAQWTVNPQSVDLIGNGFFDFYPGNGLYVDLDGSTGTAGTMTSQNIAVGPGNYELTFDLGGSQRGDVNTVDVSVDVGLASQVFTVNSGDALTLRTIDFSVGAAQNINLVFHNLGGDNVGAILDNVTVSSVGVPDGGLTSILLGTSLLGLSFLRRKF